MPLPIASGRPGELVPRALPLSGKGIRVWTQFADHVERCIAPGGVLDPIRGLANKLPEHAARIAAVLVVTGNPQTVAVAHESLEAAIAIVEHYAGEALRMFHAGHVRPELRLAQKLLSWISCSWTEAAISLPDSLRSAAAPRWVLSLARLKLPVSGPPDGVGPDKCGLSQLTEQRQDNDHIVLGRRDAELPQSVVRIHAVRHLDHPLAASAPEACLQAPEPRLEAAGHERLPAHRFPNSAQQCRRPALSAAAAGVVSPMKGWFGWPPGECRPTPP
jgi:hypothetical protein